MHRTVAGLWGVRFWWPACALKAPSPRARGTGFYLHQLGLVLAGLGQSEDAAAAVEGKAGVGRTLGVTSLASQGLVHGSVLTLRTMPGLELSYGEAWERLLLAFFDFLLSPRGSDTIL